MIRLANLTPLGVRAEEDFGADKAEGPGKDFGVDRVKDFGADADEDGGKDFHAVAGEGVGAGLGEDAGADIGGRRSLHAPSAGGEGESSFSLAPSLTRRGLAALDNGWEGKS